MSPITKNLDWTVNSDIKAEFTRYLKTATGVT
jgi:hypothetical protein